jgi:hypothetical protein
MRNRPTPYGWHTFNMNGYEKGHDSYARAKFWAQCSHGTEKSPKRLHAGFYEVTGTSGGQTFIATSAAAKQQGFTFPELD